MKRLLITGFLVLLVLISGCTQAPKSTVPGDTKGLPVKTAPETVQTAGSLPMTATVEISDFIFFPPELVIAKGGTVTWMQKDYEVHTVTGAGFDSGDLAKGKTFSHTFSEPGVYEYKSKNDPSMTGKIIVK